MFLQGQKVGKYQILRSLGSGGFGSVYLAKDSWLNIQVAIKVPHKQTTALFKMLKEPRLQAALNHPNIVRMLSAEKRENVFFMVMEYVDGGTLEDVLDEKKIIGLKTASEYILQIADAVDHAHSNQIIHRDLRPSNIMLTSANQIKITDFGTSAWLHNAPYASTRIGSPPYMAPEQFMGKATYRSDIYSIGCIFYEMLLGRPPIYDPDPFKILEKAQNGKITPPRIKNNRIPKEIDTIIMGCLASEIENRFARASDIILRIGEYRGTNPVQKEMDDIRTRIKAREREKTGTCWNCRWQLPHKTTICPRCGESNESSS
ncbi:MAG: serine/threonine protein kinase [Candidatus Aminicenantes bacterium]|nr:serine/threonine protein kinase [Candidatus Aminicenantes bacterium]